MTHVVLHGFHRGPYVTIAKLALTAKGVEFLFHDTEDAMSKHGGWTLHPFDRSAGADTRRLYSLRNSRHCSIC
jgi:hypothetical protein